MTEWENEIAHLEKLRATHRRNIRTLEERLAAYGSLERPLHLINTLEAEREQLHRVEERLAAVQAGKEPPPSARPASVTLFDQREQVVGTQINVAGDYVAQPAAGENAKKAAVPINRDQRCVDLAENIRQTMELIKQYEDQRRLADDPKAKRRAEREIADLRTQLAAYEAEHRELGCKQGESK